MKFQVLIDHTLKLDDGDMHKDHAYVTPVAIVTKETDFPSLEGTTLSNHLKHPNSIRPINAAIIAIFSCVTCSKPRGLCDSKKVFPKEKLEWVLKSCLPHTDHKCGDVVFPNNNVKTVLLPNDS